MYHFRWRSVVATQSTSLIPGQERYSSKGRTPTKSGTLPATYTDDGDGPDTASSEEAPERGSSDDSTSDGEGKRRDVAAYERPGQLTATINIWGHLT